MNKPVEQFDYIVIGGGSAGVRSSRIAAKHGAKVALIEGDRLGGTCVNRGCIPKKMLSFSASFGESLDHMHGFGWTGDCGRVNWPSLRRGVDAELDRLNGIYKNLLDGAGVETVTGFARFVDEKSVEVSGRILTAPHILIATGGTPRPAPFKGGELAKLSDDMFLLEELPQKLLVIGGGYIGLEFASIFSGLGSEVKLIHRDSLPLRGFDEDLRRHILQEFVNKPRLSPCMNTEISELLKRDDGRIEAHFDDGTSEIFDVVCAAIGRDPNVKNLALDKAGVKADKKDFIEVDENFTTSTNGIYAVGDVTQTWHLTPVAISQGHYLADQLFGPKDGNGYSCPPVATAIFTHPPIATVGLREDEAVEKGYRCAIYLSSFQPLKHKLTGIPTKTVMKVMVDVVTDKILGMHMIGEDAPEIIQGFATAFGMGLTKAQLDRTVAIHPTAAEEFVLMRTPARYVPENA